LKIYGVNQLEDYLKQHPKDTRETFMLDIRKNDDFKTFYIKDSESHEELTLEIRIFKM